MSQPTEGTSVSFSDLGLSPKLLEQLTRLKFTTPTPIQQKSIPIAIKGDDVIGIAQTGTGKTLAFAIPLIEQIAKNKKQALVILPTRELALQVKEAFSKIGQSFGLKSTLLIGGAPMRPQIQEIRRNPHVFIGTPGRLIDHMEQRILKLNNIGIVVLDEADRMLDMGFAPQINKLLANVPKEHQTMLFSATMPPEILNIASKYMQSPVRVEVAQAGTVAEKVNQELFIVQKDQKSRLLDKLLGEYPGTVLVFSRTKYGAKRICRDIQNMGHTAAEIHSNLSQSQRQRSLDGFRSGRFRVLVATDIAARGIDVTNIEMVLNFDLPDNLDDYVHRVGRTGRAGKTGHAISFVSPDQRGKIRQIERMVRTRLSVSPLPELPAGRPKSAYIERDEPRGRGGYRGARGHSSRGPSSNRGRSQGRGYQGQRSRSARPQSGRKVRMHT